MKELLSKLTVGFLILCLTLTLAACGDSGNEGTDGDDNEPASSQSSGEPAAEATIIGTWNGTMDMTEAMKAGIGEGSDAMVENLEFLVDVTFTFNNDGTYTMSMDREMLKKVYSDLMKASLTASLEASLEGTGMTVDDYLAQTGVTLDELMTQYFDIDELVDAAETEETGIYKFEDGKLYTAAEGEEIDESTYTVCELAASTLKMTEAVGEGAEEANASMFPLTLTKN